MKIFVDGISISNNKTHELMTDVFGYAVGLRNTILINCKGSIRPSLTVDRNSIASYSSEFVEILKELVSQIPLRLVEELTFYFEESEMDTCSDLGEFAVNYVLQTFDFFSDDIISELSQSPFRNLEIINFCNSEKATISIAAAVREPYFHIDGFDSRMLGRVSTKVLFGRMACASAIKVADKDVDFYSDDYIPAVKLCAEYGGWSSARSNLIIRTDEWGGCYAGYDMVTSLWPLVSPSLFDRVEERYRLGQAPLAQARYKKLYPSGNGLWGISELSSILINPDYGISRVKNSTWDNDPKIGKPGEIVDAFYLMELKNVDEEEGGGKNPIFFAVYAFVSPDPLSDEQTDDLEQYHEDRPGNEAYYQGVKEGWSVLFLGDGNYYFKAGLCPKSELIEVAKKDASLGDKVGCYRNLDGSKLFSK